MRTLPFVPWLAAVVALFAHPVGAHGPTVTLDAESLDPATLEIERGQTVHFANTGETPLRIRGEGDSFRSPELGPGEGWHLPFPFPGRFEYALEGAPAVRGVVAVEEPR